MRGKYIRRSPEAEAATKQESSNDKIFGKLKYDDGDDGGAEDKNDKGGLVEEFKESLKNELESGGRKKEKEDDIENLSMDDAIDNALLESLDEEREGKKDEKIKEVVSEDEVPEGLSEKAGDHFKKLMASRDEYKKKASELEGKASIPVIDTKEYKELEAQLTELKEIVSQEHFEQDPGFIETYKKPVFAAIEKVKRWVNIEDEGDVEKATQYISAMSQFARDGNESGFFKLADKVSSLLDGGESTKNRFITSVGKWYDAVDDYNKALSDKEKTKENIVKSREAAVSQNKNKSISAVKAIANNWKEANKETIDFFEKNKDKIGFDPTSVINKNIEQVGVMLERLSSTGEIPPDLSAFIVNGGITGEIIDKKYNMAVNSLKSLTERVSALQEELSLKDKQIEKLTGKPSGKTASPPSKVDDDDDEEESGLVAEFKRFNK